MFCRIRFGKYFFIDWRCSLGIFWGSWFRGVSNFGVLEGDDIYGVGESYNVKNILVGLG